MNRKFIKNSNIVLKNIFNSNNCLDILKNFIEAFLNIQIINIKFNKNPLNKNQKNQEENTNKVTNDMGFADVRIETADGEELNVGIQIVDGDYVQNKMFLYYAKIHTNQVSYDDNRKIAKTITINILDFQYFSSKQYHKKISIKTNMINDNILETIEMHVLELPKFKINPKEELTDKEAWMIYLQGQDINLMNYAKEENSKIKKLDNLLEKYWEDEKIE